VAEVFRSGSLARSTQLDPVHGVDLVVVYLAADHPDWPAGQSAGDALGTRGRVTDMLGTNGTVDKLVRYTRWRNRAVVLGGPARGADAFCMDACRPCGSPTARCSSRRQPPEWITVDRST
jgi:hypothetical protein